MFSEPAWLALVFAATLAASYVLVRFASRLGGQLGLVDQPRPGEIQVRSVPRTGGYAMFAALWIGIVLSLILRPAGLSVNSSDDWKLLGILLGSLLILPLAALDDRNRLQPLPQLGAQFAIAAVPVLFGLRLGSIASPFGAAVELPFWLDIPLTLLWIVGMINAMNLIDVIDGLAAGIAAMAALVLFTRSLWFDQASIAVLPLVLAAAAIGFLPHNFPPARVFMGTSGSVMLGYCLATMSVVGGAKVGTAFVLLGVPILDTAWVIMRRVAQRRSPFKGGDLEHLPQRIHALGLSQVQTVLVLYLICGTFGWLALSLHSPAEAPTPAKVLLIAGMVAVMVVVLGTVTLLSVRRRRADPAGTASRAD